MERIPEPELMDDPAQALAYAEADFSAPHDHFVELVAQRFGSGLRGTVLDLGCGPGDICRRFARRFPDCRIHGIDASTPMLELARRDTRAAALDQRIRYFSARLPGATLPLPHYDLLLSNSLLHHLSEPAVLWESIIRHGRAGSRVFVMDLLRPGDRARAESLLKTYAADEPAVLQNDFFHSLLAAYRPDEVRQQLAQQGLERLEVEVVSDRHFIVCGEL
ncbi:MAG TPA: methyltransferase domain-containing protein [Gammaproteobacteria bacterium]|nr:methyltransferase domain-containing protein [Gammaproteobacteria bacterium]